MNYEIRPLAEITEEAIHILCRELGPVNTARFLNQFTNGRGDYTRERDQLFGDLTVDQIVSEIRSAKEKNAD